MSHGESDASRDGGGDPAGAPGPAERQLGQSVLPRLEEKAHASIRIDLASSDGTGAGGARTGRYVLRGELGRGGVGVVLQGSDADLGREVAIKVLREEFENQPDVVKRFVEEAQIGGQLQHPGVVPVYDLGLSDGRPFFAMRLIRGKALDVLLAQREQPSAERRRFLDIFEKVCQTVAYAHARGVIHRDIKPSNVMVGAFGEVQVVDWGMGKVLGTGPRPAAASTSEAGRPVEA
ncbi:MAG: serine/threonine-protein kinase [Planctomycetota bacterium]